MAIAIVSVEQMREWESATWSAGQTKQEVIQRVGKIIALRTMQLTQEGDLILVLSGKGHNGDDARAALSQLQRNTILLDVLDPKVSLEKFSTICKSTSKPKLILDGLFGIGLDRPLNHDWQKLIAAVNESRIRVLSIDIPSGVDAGTGEARGAAIQAMITLTLGAPKRGLFSPSAIPFVGRLEVAPEIGLIPCPFSSDLNWTCAEDFQNFPPPRVVSRHKGSFGHVSIFAGSFGFHGAAVLAARGALRAQPGLVTLFTPEKIYTPVASQLQAAMVHAWVTTADVPDSCTAILCGPGLAGKDLPDNYRRETIEIWTECPLPVVVDASALDWLPKGGNFQNRIRVITPHPAEAARMLSISTEAVQSNRVAAMQKLSSHYGNCFVVLKGHQTVVGKNDGKVFINSSGNPFLAQGGSGDVLAGYISGLLAQPTLQSEPLKTIRYAVWQHGAAADNLCDNQLNWTVSDLLKILGQRIT